MYQKAVNVFKIKLIINHKVRSNSSMISLSMLWTFLSSNAAQLLIPRKTITANSAHNDSHWFLGDKDQLLFSSRVAILTSFQNIIKEQTGHRQRHTHNTSTHNAYICPVAYIIWLFWHWWLKMPCYVEFQWRIMSWLTSQGSTQLWRGATAPNPRSEQNPRLWSSWIANIFLYWTTGIEHLACWVLSSDRTIRWLQLMVEQ